MPLNHHDFFPEVRKTGSFTKEHESFASVAARARDWVEREGVRVINVETVLLPNANDPEECEDTEFDTSGKSGSYWHQMVRVWYDDTRNP